MEGVCVVDRPDRISPLHDLAVPKQPENGVFGVELSERLCDSLVQVQAWPKTLPRLRRAITQVTGVKPKSGQAVGAKDEILIMPTGPGRYLLEDGSEDLEARLREAIGSDIGAVTGLTHGRVVVTIQGEKAAWVLATGIAIDFHPAAFPVGEVLLTHHHETGLCIHRTREDAFELYVFTSFARSFWGWITRAADEVGYCVG